MNMVARCTCPLCCAQVPLRQGAYRQGAYPTSGSDAIDALLARDFSGNFAKWDVPPGGSIRFSFVTAASARTYPASEDEIPIEEVNDRIKENVRDILRAFATVLSVNFVEVSDSANSQIRIMFSNGPGVDGNAYTYDPSLPGVGGAIHLQKNNEDNPLSAYSGEPGNFGYSTLIHELGHALGLKHPGNYDAAAEEGEENVVDPPFLPFADDHTRNTVMSYNPYDAGLEPSTLMAYDIRSLQFLYGARSDFAGGDTTYGWTRDNFLDVLQSIWDGGGTDTLDFSQLPDDRYVFDLHEGGVLTARSELEAIPYQATSDPSGEVFTTFGFGTVIGFGVQMEHLIGSIGQDEITGNALANWIRAGRNNDQVWGDRGNDVLVGGKGFDSLQGGKGFDQIFGDRGEDWLWGDGGEDTLNGGAGADRFGLKVGKGVDRITDFEDGSDRLILPAGVTVGQLVITQGEDRSLIQLGATGEVLAQLLGVPASSLDGSDFIA